jgi:hypothetical protein
MIQLQPNMASMRELTRGRFRLQSRMVITVIGGRSVCRTVPLSRVTIDRPFRLNASLRLLD